MITGAARGIGKAVAIALARAGAKVAVNDLPDEDDLASTVAVIRDEGWDARVAPADVGDPAQVGAMVEEIARGWGGVDVLVNNAGISPVRPFLEFSAAEWNQVVRTNLTGAALCSQAVLRGMVEQGQGRIINISSVHSETTCVNRAAYAASKGGLNALTRALAMEFGPQGISVNALIVGAVVTERTLKTPYTEEQWEDWKRTIPSGRWGTAEEVARAVLFLADPEAEWINGACLQIDGGQQSLLAHPKRPVD